jgi:hypothetical protein
MGMGKVLTVERCTSVEPRFFNKKKQKTNNQSPQRAVVVGLWVTLCTTSRLYSVQ